MTSKRTIARLAGCLYLMLALLGPFSLMYVPTTLIDPSDAARTAGNMLAHQGLYRLGLVGQALILIVEIVLTVLLYVLLKAVSDTLSLIAAFARLAMTVVQGVNVLYGIAALQLLTGAAYATVFDGDELHGLVANVLDLQQAGVLVWEVFFGLHLIVLGCLFVSSIYIPRLLGGMVVLAGFGYLIHSFGNLLFPDYDAILEWIVIVLAIPEVALTVWLLIRGVDVRQPNHGRAVASTPASRRLLPDDT